MFRQGTGVKLMDRPERDAQGQPTGKLRGRPTYDIMIAPDQLTPEEAEALAPYRHHPQHIDDCWAGQETHYYRFTTEQECRAKLNRFLRKDDE